MEAASVFIFNFTLESWEPQTCQEDRWLPKTHQCLMGLTVVGIGLIFIGNKLFLLVIKSVSGEIEIFHILKVIINHDATCGVLARYWALSAVATKLTDVHGKRKLFPFPGSSRLQWDLKQGTIQLWQLVMGWVQGSGLIQAKVSSWSGAALWSIPTEVVRGASTYSSSAAFDYFSRDINSDVNIESYSVK